MDLQEFVTTANNGNMILDCIWIYSDSLAAVERLYNPYTNELTDEGVKVIEDVRNEIALHLKNAGESEITAVVKTIRRHILMPRALQYIAGNQKMLKQHYARFVNKQDREDCYGDTVYLAVADCLSRYQPTIGPFEPYLKRWVGWMINKWRKKREPEKYRCTNFTTLFGDALPKHEESRYEFSTIGNQEKLIDGEDMRIRAIEYEKYVSPEHRLILKLRYVDNMPYNQMASLLKKSPSFIAWWIKDAESHARLWLASDDIDKE